METKQIIHNTLQSAEDEVTTLEAKVKHLHNDKTTSYTYVVKHPTVDKWAVRYNTSGKYWALVEEHLAPSQIDSLVEITEDWIPDDILI